MAIKPWTAVMTIMTILFCVGMIAYGWLYSSKNPAHNQPHPEGQMGPVEVFTTPCLKN